MEVSSAGEELQHEPARPDRHLIKLHGTISWPDTIILTRGGNIAFSMSPASIVRTKAANATTTIRSTPKRRAAQLI
jgi:hypothetical protein